jgi:L-amino acid N-acyltransferase YncA
MIRLATAGDSAAILAIYVPYIRDTSITFETDIPTEAEFAHRIETYLQNFPWLVYEQEGTITGYAYAARYRERTAYQWSVECSVYIAQNSFRSGLARALYTALLDILKHQGFTLAYAVINLPNPQSVGFHESLGFTYFATYEKVGYKLGQWKNVGWWRRQLNEFVQEPSAPVKFSEMDRSVLPGIFSHAEQLIRPR